MRESQTIPFKVGDLICHGRMNDESDDKKNVGHVIGFCPGVDWVRIRTIDGRQRIWLKANIHNVDHDMATGNYAPVDSASALVNAEKGVSDGND